MKNKIYNKRIMAFLLDSFVICCCLFIVFLVTDFTSFIFIKFELTYFIYFFILEYFFNKTFGKFILEIEVKHNKKQNKFIAIIIRNIVRLTPIDMFPIIFGYGTKTYHDLFSNTNVYHIQK